jgi:hypothetical protein
MFLLLVFCAAPVWLASYADQLWQFVLLGLTPGTSRNPTTAAAPKPKVISCTCQTLAATADSA